MKKLSVLPLVFLMGSLLFAIPSTTLTAHGALTGTVCFNTGPTLGCAGSGPIFTGTSKAPVTVSVNIAGSDAFNGFDVAVFADPTVISAASVDLSTTVLAPGSPFIQNICINNVVVKGSCSPGVDGPGVVHVTDIVFGFVTTSPTTGNLFNIAYTVTGTSTGVTIGYVSSPSQCPTSSSPPLCVTIASPGGAADPEILQTATFANQAAPPDFNFSVSPTSGTVVQGSTTQTVVTTTVVSGTPGLVSFMTSALPSGVTTTFSPTTCAPPCSSTLTFTATTTATTGAVTVTIRGTASGIQPKTATYGLTVQQAPKDFTITATPSSLTIVQGGLAQTSDIDLTGSNGFADTIQLTTKVIGSNGPQAIPNPSSVMLSSASASSTSILSVSAAASATLGSYVVTVNATGLATGTSHSIPVFVTIVAPTASPDFALSANPSSLFIARGNLAPSLITVRSLSGFAGALTFTASIFPSGPTVSLSQKTVVLIARGSWTLVAWVFTTTSTAPGTYTLTVTATNGSVSHSVKITVTVL